MKVPIATLAMPVGGQVMAPDHIPFPVQANFRMQPGLRRYDGPLTCRDEDFADTQQCVQRAVREGWMPVGQWQTANLSAAIDETNALLLSERVGAAAGPARSLLGRRASVADRLLDLRRQVQEDLVLLAPGSAGQVVAMAVGLPSGWSPADKLGLDFAQIHAAVPEAAAIRRSAAQLMRLPQRGSVYQRFVWTLTADGQLSQHPAHQKGAAPGDPVWFRVERQLLMTLSASRFGLFLIRVYRAPLSDVLAVDPQRAGCLCASLRSMSDAVIRYKNLSVLRQRVLQDYDGAGAGLFDASTLP